MVERQEIIQIARLARLELSAEEIERYRNDLNRFLLSSAGLDKVDTADVEGTAHPLEASHGLREDRVEESLGRDAVLAGAPAVEGGFFRVPRIVEGVE